MSQRIPHLYIAPSDIDDRGVFSSQPIPKSSIIEICGVIVIPGDEMEYLKKTVLYNYYFDWNEESQSGAIALGYGSLYNHSYEPNTEYVLDYESNTLAFHALRDIEAGEEITINYNGDPDDQDKVWFEIQE
ncbi:MAG: SET domain-containing protein [Saprospiraceae bacterium]|jgi:SET domain-containing protein